MEQEKMQAELSQAKRELDEATATMVAAMRIHGKKLERWLHLQEQATREARVALHLEPAGGVQ